MPLIQEEWAKAGIQPESPDRAWLLSTIDLLKTAGAEFEGFCHVVSGFFTDEFENDPAAVGKFLKDDAVRGLIVELGDRYAASSNGFSEQDTEKVLRILRWRRVLRLGL